MLFVGDAAANTLGLRLLISYEDLALGKRMLAKLAALPFSVALFGQGRTIAPAAASGRQEVHDLPVFIDQLY